MNYIDDQFEKMRAARKPLTLEEKLDWIYDTVDSLMQESKFQEIDVWLRTVSTNKRSLDELVAILTVTLPIKTKLPSRVGLIVEIKRELEKRGEWEQNLLKGLE